MNNSVNFNKIVENLRIIYLSWTQNTHLIPMIIHFRRARAILALARRRNSARVIPLSPDAIDCFAS
ncbi:MAG: hypothetical protein ACREOI_35910, partial [bacterium]